MNKKMGECTCVVPFAYCLASVLLSGLVAYARALIPLEVIVVPWKSTMIEYATCIIFMLISFIYVFSLKWIMYRFRLNVHAVSYVRYYSYVLPIIGASAAMCLYFDNLGNGSQVLSSLIIMVPIYAIAFAGTFFIFMRWYKALLLHIIVYVFAFGFPFGVIPLIIFAPLNIAYYAIMIYWGRKSLYPSYVLLSNRG